MSRLAVVRALIVGGALTSLVATGAASPSPPLAAPTTTDEIVGVAVAAGLDLSVVWSRHRIRSLDGSRFFLEGSEEVRAVALGGDGTVYAIRGNRLGVARVRGTSKWHHTPVAGKTLGLEVLGDSVAWFAATDSSSVLALTGDGGRSWTVQTLPPIIDEGHLRLLPGGALELAGYVYDCHGGDYSVRYRGRVGSNRWRQVATGPETDYLWPSHFGPDDYDRYPWVAGPNGTYRVDQPQLLQLSENGSQIVLDEHVPDGLQLMAIDHRDRLLGLSGGRVWRWSARDRWQLVGGPVPR